MAAAAAAAEGRTKSARCCASSSPALLERSSRRTRAEPGTTEPDPAMAIAVINAMKEEGILIGAAGADGNILKLRPPLCLEREHVDFFLENLFEVLQRLSP